MLPQSLIGLYSPRSCLGNQWQQWQFGVFCCIQGSLFLAPCLGSTYSMALVRAIWVLAQWHSGLEDIPSAPLGKRWKMARYPQEGPLPGMRGLVTRLGGCFGYGNDTSFFPVGALTVATLQFGFFCSYQGSLLQWTPFMTVSGQSVGVDPSRAPQLVRMQSRVLGFQGCEFDFRADPAILAGLWVCCKGSPKWCP